INTTFYKFPTVKSLQKWYDSSPEDFKFTVKAPRLITHYKRFTECDGYLKDFYETSAEGLKDKLGCILFQMHPQIKYSEGFLKNIISSLNPSFKNVLEFRDASWWNKSAFNTLKKNKIIFSGISYPKLPDALIIARPNLYYRFHGVPVLYKSAYTPQFLEEKFSEINKSGIKEAWIYFNNTWGTAAIENARYLQNLFEKNE
ncbi:MAG: DUF72 domain-containing protein, partial [Ginsengibacter sp.]